MRFEPQLHVSMIGTPEGLRNWAIQYGKHVEEVAVAARQLILKSKGEVAEWQAMCLYALGTRIDLRVRQHDEHVCRALEIGTLLGYSGYFIARGMPHSYFITLNPNDRERRVAKKVLGKMVVECSPLKSWDFLAGTTDFYDFIFVDGDHARVALDLPWFNRLQTDGLIIFHDYSPAGSGRPCVPVFNAVNMLADDLGRLPDVLLMDSNKIGLAGFYRREGEVWQSPTQPK